MISSTDSKQDHLIYQHNIQNEVNQIIGNHTKGKILKGLQGKVFYSSMTNKVIDTQFWYCEFLYYAYRSKTTREAIANKLIKLLCLLAILIENIRGHAYNGTSAMSSKKWGCRNRIKSVHQPALYTHCRSQVLNPSIASTCRLPLKRNRIDIINTQCSFSLTVLLSDKSFLRLL